MGTLAAPDVVAERLRCRYTKTGKLRFVGAIDLGRVWERALRKAGLPIAYSEGFSPHPKVSFPDALPLGYASEGEYVELVFAGPVPVRSSVAALNAAFPEGMAVLAAEPVRDGEPRLSRWLRASAWELEYPQGVDPQALSAGAAGLERARQLPVDRERKGEVTEIDLRPALHQISTTGTRVRVVLHHTEPPMRPSEVHQALRRQFPAIAPEGGEPLPEPILVTRLAQGSPTDRGLEEALTGAVIPPASTDLREDSDHRDRRHQPDPRPGARADRTSPPSPRAAGGEREPTSRRA